MNYRAIRTVEVESRFTPSTTFIDDLCKKLGMPAELAQSNSTSYSDARALALREHQFRLERHISICAEWEE